MFLLLSRREYELPGQTVNQSGSESIFSVTFDTFHKACFSLVWVGLRLCGRKLSHVCVCFVFRPQRLSAERNTSDSDSVGVSTGENGRDNGEKV